MRYEAPLAVATSVKMVLVAFVGLSLKELQTTLVGIIDKGGDI
jgi:hypothetical protein